jgi:hypothetical protein
LKTDSEKSLDGSPFHVFFGETKFFIFDASSDARKPSTLACRSNRTSSPPRHDRVSDAVKTLEHGARPIDEKVHLAALLAPVLFPLANVREGRGRIVFAHRAPPHARVAAAVTTPDSTPSQLPAPERRTLESKVKTL